MLCVVYHGAGVRFRPTARAAMIATAIQQVLDDPIYAAARRLAANIADDLTEDRALTARGARHPWFPQKAA